MRHSLEKFFDRMERVIVLCGFIGLCFVGPLSAAIISSELEVDLNFTILGSISTLVALIVDGHPKSHDQLKTWGCGEEMENTLFRT